MLLEASADFALDGDAIRKSWRRVAPGQPPLEVAPAGDEGALVLRSARIGAATLRFSSKPMDGADEAFKRSLSAIITDDPAPKHNAHIRVTLAPPSGLAAKDALDLVARLSIAIARAHDGVGVHFGSGAVLHPAKYALATLRDDLPLAWLWVGIELGGTTSELTLTSRGLAVVGLRELSLVVERADIGRAIQSYFELLALMLQRGEDFPDGHELPRQDAPPFVVRHAVHADGTPLARIVFPAP